MKKGILLFSILFAYVAAYSQCYLVPNGLPEGFYPPNDSIPCIVRALPSSTILTFNCPSSITLSGVTLPVQYIIFDSIINMPCGLSWNTLNNPVAPNEAACIYFHGNIIDTIGQYKLKLRARVRFAAFSSELLLDLDDLGHPVYLRVKENFQPCQPFNASNPSRLSACYPSHTNGNTNIVSGKVYLDKNQNGIFDSLDFGISQYKIRIGNTQVFTDRQGNYQLALPVGSFLIVPDSSAAFSLTSSPNQYLINNVTLGNLNSGLDFGLSVNQHTSDIIVSSASSLFRVGQPSNFTISVINFGTTPVAPTLYFYHDTIFQYDTSNVLPTAQSPGQIIWNVDTLQLGQTAFYHVTMAPLNGLSLMGSQVSTTAFVESTANDIDLSNDTSIITETILAAYDPNDKTAYPDVLSQEFVDGNKYIVYRIRLQNTGNDTAFNITVRDTINSPFLDINSIQLLSASHDYKFRIDDGNIGIWEFPNILLPDSNVNEPGSHGYIFFRIRVKNAGVTNGTEIINQLGIYFDSNPVIMTDPSIAKVDFGIGIRNISYNNSSIHIYPNPAQNRLVINHNQWQQGASIVLYDLSGKAMLTQPLDGKTTEISTANLPNGMYLYQALGASGIEGLGKVVIAK